MKKISVVIPAFNCEKTIEKTIDSVLKQTLQGIEIILVDDGSTDNTENICKKYFFLKESFRYFKRKNSGCAAARNFGVEKATGKYIVFLDSDDWVDSRLYENMYRKAETEKLDIVLCGIKKMDENLQELATVTVEKFSHLKDYLDTDAEWFPSPCNKLYRKNIFNDSSFKFLENIACGEDMLFNFKIFSQVLENSMDLKIGVEKEFYYYYFMNTTSISNNYKNRLDIYDVIDEMIKFSKNKNIYEAVFSEIEKSYKFHGIAYPFDILQRLKENSDPEFKKAYKAIKNGIKRFNYLQNLHIKVYYIYRKFRLQMMFLKRYIKGR